VPYPRGNRSRGQSAKKSERELVDEGGATDSVRAGHRHVDSLATQLEVRGPLGRMIFGTQLQLTPVFPLRGR
jgi:hypothetical protein